MMGSKFSDMIDAVLRDARQRADQRPGQHRLTRSDEHDAADGREAPDGRVEEVAARTPTASPETVPARVRVRSGDGWDQCEQTA